MSELSIDLIRKNYGQMEIDQLRDRVVEGTLTHEAHAIALEVLVDRGASIVALPPEPNLSLSDTRRGPKQGRIVVLSLVGMFLGFFAVTNAIGVIAAVCAFARYPGAFTESQVGMVGAGAVLSILFALGYFKIKNYCRRLEGQHESQ
jgi:hypothetical protein